MKYQLTTTLILLLLFTLTEFTGLFITLAYHHKQLPYTLEPPPVTSDWSPVYIITGVLITTALFYLLTKLRFDKLIKLWFSSAVLIGLSVSLSLFINDLMALIVSAVLTIIRLMNRDQVVHNLTEVLLYGGIVAVFQPLFNPLSALILLIIISIYDYISVNVTKHMVLMAQAQASNNLFTGLIVKRGSETAILGGGDIAFSLLFASVMSTAHGVLSAYLTIYLVLITLTGLTLLSHKGKYYPAMPFITTACVTSFLLTINII